MVLCIIGILFLLIMMRRGYQAGLVAVSTKLLLWVLVFYIANQLSKPLGDWISQWVSGQFIRPGVPQTISHDGSQFLASGLAFLILTTLGGILSHYLLRSIHFVRRIPILGSLDGWLGGIFYAALAAVMLFFLLQVLSVIPNLWIQEQLLQTPILNNYLDHFPFFSETIYQWWL